MSPEDVLALHTSFPDSYGILRIPEQGFNNRLGVKQFCSIQPVYVGAD